MSSKLSLLTAMAAIGTVELRVPEMYDFNPQFNKVAPHNGKRKNKRKLSKKARRNNR